jgi:hypothetical protein
MNLPVLWATLKTLTIQPSKFEYHDHWALYNKFVLGIQNAKFNWFFLKEVEFFR